MFKIDTANRIIIEPELLMIPEFNTIWVNDLTPEKVEAYAYYKYIFFMCDYKSPYNSYGLDKEDCVLRDYFNGATIDKSEVLIKAMEKYNELRKIPEVHVLEASRELMFRVAQKMSSMELEGRAFKEATDALSNVGKVLASYGQVKDSVERELGKQGKSRGDRKRGSRED